MDEWKKSYEKSNWAQRRDKEEDERRENYYKNIININFPNLERDLTNKERLAVLRVIHDAYETLKREAFDYDEEEAKFIAEQFEKFKWKVMQEEWERSPGAQSWEDFRKEEEAKSKEEEK